MTPAEFGERFLLPLVAGGTLHVGAPLGRAGLSRLRETKLDGQTIAEIHAARATVACELLYDPIAPELDLESLRLAVAVHDLLFLFHPSAADLRERKLGAVASYAAALARLSPTRNADTLVARHSILHRLQGLGRTDVRVSFWVGHREFHGQDPPRRLTLWPSVRRVREERRRVNCFVEAASHPLGGEVVRALLDGSPLTDLLHPVRIEPRLDLGRHLAVLFVPELCRLVAHAWLDEGLGSVGGAIATAILAELDSSAGRAARFVCALFAHLHLCALLGIGIGSPATGLASARDRRPAPRLAVGGDPALRDFYGLFAALHRTTPELASPFDVRSDPRLAREVEEYALACTVACGPIRVGELAKLVARAGGPIALSLGTSD